MPCPRCAATATIEQSRRTALAYRTFRCGRCRRMFKRAAVAGAPTMLGPLAAQGEAVLAAIVAEVAADLATSLDDDGLAFPQPSNVAVARKG